MKMANDYHTRYRLIKAHFFAGEFFLKPFRQMIPGIPGYEKSKFAQLLGFTRLWVYGITGS
jgi:hypothetical protein